MSSNIFGDVTTQPKYEVKIGIILSQEMNNKKTKRDKNEIINRRKKREYQERYRHNMTEEKKGGEKKIH